MLSSDTISVKSLFSSEFKLSISSSYRDLSRKELSLEDCMIGSKLKVFSILILPLFSKS